MAFTQKDKIHKAGTLVAEFEVKILVKQVAKSEVTFFSFANAQKKRSKRKSEQASKSLRKNFFLFHQQGGLGDLPQQTTRFAGSVASVGVVEDFKRELTARRLFFKKMKQIAQVESKKIRN